MSPVDEALHGEQGLIYGGVTPTPCLKMAAMQWAERGTDGVAVVTKLKTLNKQEAPIGYILTGGAYFYYLT